MYNTIKNSNEGLNNSDFFLENNPNGFMTKQDFIDYHKNFNELDIKHFIETLLFSGQKHKIFNLSDATMDKWSKRYVVWFEFENRIGLKRRLVFTQGIYKFLLQCKSGKLNHNFDLHGLLFEANLINTKIHHSEPDFSVDFDEFDLQKVNIRELSINDSVFMNLNMDNF